MVSPVVLQILHACILFSKKHGRLWENTWRITRGTVRNMISQQLLINGGKEGLDGRVVNWRGSVAKLEEKREEKRWLEGWKKKE